MQSNFNECMNRFGLQTLKEEKEIQADDIGPDVLEANLKTIEEKYGIDPSIDEEEDHADE
jgi:hypothetical protein